MTAEQFDKYADEFMENFKRATMLIMDIESN
jgi:hypothetical protein